MDKSYVYCQVLLEGVKFTYSYISDFDIKVGDIVVVPFGYQNTERAALVVAVDEHTAETAPYPPEKTKHISRLFDQQENPVLEEEKARLEEKAPAYKTAASDPQTVSAGLLKLSADGKTVTGFKKPAGNTPLDIVIPEGVEIIQDHVFNRVNIARMTLPKTVKNVGNLTFHTPTPAPVWEYYLKDVESVQVARGNPYYAADETGFYSLHDGKKRLEFLFDRSIEEYTAPDDVVSFSDYAFHGCKNLKKVTLSPFAIDFTEYCLDNTSLVKEIFIPASVKTLYPKPWDGGYAQWSVVSYKIDKDSNYFFRTENAIYQNLDDGSYRLVCCTDDKEKEFILLDNTSEIADNAFQGREKLKKIELPASLKKIGANAFENTDIRTIDIPKGVEYIGAYAFSGTAIKNLKLPSTLKFVHDYAFDGNFYLNKVTFAGRNSPYVYEDNSFKKVFAPKKRASEDDKNYEKKLFEEFATVITAAVKENSYNTGHSQDSAVYDAENRIITVITKFYQDAEKNTTLVKERIRCAEKLHRGDSLSIRTDDNYWQLYSSDGKNLGDLFYSFDWYSQPYKKFITVENATVHTITPKSKREPGTKYATGTVRFEIREKNTLNNMTNQELQNMGRFKYKLTQDRAVITGLIADYNSGVLTIPARLEGKAVISFTDAVLNSIYNHKFTKLVISEGIKNVGAAALYNLGDIKTIVFPESVEFISPHVFARSDGSLKDYYPNKKSVFVAPAGSYAENFLKSYPLEIYGEHNILTVINRDTEEAHSRAKNLSCFNFTRKQGRIHASFDFFEKAPRHVYLPRQVNNTPVTEINLHQINRIEVLHIPATVTHMKGLSYTDIGINYLDIAYDNTAYYSDGYAVYSKDKKTLYRFMSADAESYTVPDGVETIGENAFGTAFKLQKLSLPQSLQTIGKYAFSHCTKLETITGLEYLKGDCRDMFGDITKYKLEIPFIVNTNVVIVGDTLIKYNDLSQKTLCLPNGITTIAACALGWENSNDCTQEIIIPPSVKVIGNNAFEGRTKLKTINIPQGVKELPANAFRLCDSLEKLYIPASVENIHPDAFPLNKKVPVFNAIEVDKNNKHYCSVDGMLLSKDGSLLLHIPSGYPQDCITTPASVKEIADNAASGNRFIREVVIGPGTTEIGEEAFAGCLHLENVVLPQGLQSIGDSAFESTALKKIHLPDTVVNIGCDAFENTHIKRVVLPVSAINVHDYAFKKNTIVDKGNLEKSYGKYYKEMLHDGDNIFVVFRGSTDEIKNLCDYLDKNSIEYSEKEISAGIEEINIYHCADEHKLVIQFPQLTATGMIESYGSVYVWFSDPGYPYFTDYVEVDSVDSHAEGGAGRWTWEIYSITESYRGSYTHMSTGTKAYTNYRYPFMSKWNRAVKSSENDSIHTEYADSRLYIKVKFENGKSYRYFCEYKVDIGDTVFVPGKMDGQPGTVVEILNTQPTGQAEAYTLYVKSVGK